MNNKKILFSLFALMVLAQLLAPSQMIYTQENILASGKLFKFKTQPVDPNDPFRGKYISLSFDQNKIFVKNSTNFHEGETVFVKLKTDTDGFAKITSISKTEPAENFDYLKLKINYLDYNNKNIIYLDLPFNQFFMNENKAQSAETVYQESNKIIQNNTCALVAIKSGKAVLKDVLIDNISVRKLANKKP